MSYARFGAGGSDVYVYAHVGGFIECCGCSLDDDQWRYDSPEDVVAHMREHEAAGDTVPAHLFDIDTYPPRDFIAMCPTHMCRKDEGHDGEHTPTDAQGERIRGWNA